MARIIDKAMPLTVVQALDAETIATLQADGHSITFPDEIGCQVRLQSGEDHYSTYLRYDKNGGILSTVKQAIDIAAFIRNLFISRKCVYVRQTKTCGVSTRRISKGGGSYETYHCVRYLDPHNNKFRYKSFYHGKDGLTPGQWLHVQHTALMFRELANDLYSLGKVPNCKHFLGWKHVRLYRVGSAPVKFEDL